MKILFNELKEYGNILNNSLFYSNFNDLKLNEKSLKYGFTSIIMEPSFSEAKNAVDIRIALEVMDIANKDYINCFCLATNDLDFAPILKKLKEKNKLVIGAGNFNTNDNYKKLCDRFISVDKIYEAQNQSKNYQDKEPIHDLVETVKSIINDLNEEDGYVRFSQVIESLYKEIRDFNPKNYGSKNSKTSKFFQNDLEKYFNLKLIGKTYFIKIK